MLTEEMRILAGLQNSKKVENKLPSLIQKEKQKIFDARQRIVNEQKNVLSHFDIFKEKIEKYNNIMFFISKLFESGNIEELKKGLYESKYKKIQTFADIVINDSLSITMGYLENHYDEIKNEIDKIMLLTEKIDEQNGKTFFVAKTLISHDLDHNIKIPIFKDKLLEQKISNEIHYGSEIIYLTEKLSIIKYDGKKFYTKISLNNIDDLEKKGFLI